MFVHDLIKINLSREGYLPNYPPHLISDEEMCNAFLPYEYNEDDPLFGFDSCMRAELNFFRDYYPEIHPQLHEKYKKLVSEIAYHLNEMLKSNDDEYQLPNWVYAYMLKEVVTVDSDIRDRHDLFVMLGTDNLEDEFNYDCGIACYRESSYWIKKLPVAQREHRPPTIFGEPHVIKSLRLKAADLTDAEISNYIDSESTEGKQV